MNSILKNSKKIQKNMNFLHPRCSGVQGVCKILMCSDIGGARGEKTFFANFFEFTIHMRIDLLFSFATSSWYV